MNMEYQTREYPLFSACGLNCGLCPRYHTGGRSKCPGCAGEGFSDKHPPCGVLSCCQRKGVEYCFMCDEYPCGKYKDADLYDSFITHKNQFHDFEKAKRRGVDVYKAELNRKLRALGQLLENYDDGRRKSFFCLAVNLLDLPNIEIVMEQLSGETNTESPLKSKAMTAVRLFEELSLKRGVSLRLRKKQS